MKHKHYDIIVAKAANTDLVVFVRDGSHWNELDFQAAFYEVNNYFLCLPQHKEACLHWLNGGDVQINRKGEGFLDWSRPSREWMKEVSFMFDINQFRIKPKKEKRWISIRKLDQFVECVAWHSELEAKDDCPSVAWTHHQVEVEV